MTSSDLAQLIAAHSRLILPNLGAFLHKDTADEKFSPYNITFSPFLKYNDGKLEDYLSKTKGISKEESFKQVHALVSSIKQQLESSGKYPIPGLGQLVRDSQGAITFVVDSSVNNVTEETGIPEKISDAVVMDEGNTSEKGIGTGGNKSLQDKPSNNKSTSEKHSNAINNLDAEQKSDDETGQNALTSTFKAPDNELENTWKQKIFTNEVIPDRPDKDIPKMVKKRNSRRRNKLLPPFLFIITSLVVIFIIALVIRHIALSPNYNYADEEVAPEGDFTQGTPNIETSPKPKDKIDAKYDSLVDLAKKKEGNPTSSELSIEDKIEQEVIENYKANDSKPTGKYYLIVGSYKNAENAQNMASMLKAKGYKSSVVLRPNGISCVAIGAYSSDDQAQKAKLSFVKQFPGIWVLNEQ